LIPRRAYRLVLAFAVLLGAVTVGGFAPFGLTAVPIVTIALLFALWQRAEKPRHAAAIGFAFGLGLFSAGATWVYIALATFGGMPAFIAALATAFLYMRQKRMPALKTADVLAPAVALGHSIGRVGCFAAGCCWGIETHLPWAVTFTNPEAQRLVGVPLGIPLHPTQLYEALAEALIFAILWWRFGKPHRPGSMLSLYLVLYGLTRFLVEFVRSHDPQSNPYTGPLTTEQWLALSMVALGAGLWLWTRRNMTEQSVPVHGGAAS